MQRHVEAERLGSSQVDDQLEFGRRLDRQVGGPSTAQDAVDVVGRLSVVLRNLDAVADQPALGDELAKRIDDGQAMTGCQGEHQLAVHQRESIGENEDRKSTRLNSSHANISYA